MDHSEEAPSPASGHVSLAAGHPVINDEDSALGSFSETPEQSGISLPADQSVDPVNRPILDTDSAFGDDEQPASTYTTSVTSSIWNYEYENGRRYHAFRAGQYIIPNDEKEQDRLDLMHHIFNMTLGGKLHLAPIGNSPQRVLDVGTGTGIWAIDFADLHPSAEVIGLDLSPIQPIWVPVNLQFQIDDCESPWTFPRSKPFDFIKMRAMGGSIANWPGLLRQAYDYMRPGGWIELTDFDAWASTDDNSLPEDSSYHEFQTRLEEAATKFGRRMNVGPHHKQALIDTGFVDVVHDCRKVPLSPWPKDPKQKEMGRYMQLQMLDAVESYGLAPLTRVLGWSTTRTQVLIAGVRRDLRNKNYHMYSNCHSVYGQKPFN